MVDTSHGADARRGGYRDGDTDIPAAQMEAERKKGQTMLASLSSNSTQLFIPSGHNTELESPDAVAAAIKGMIGAIHTHHKF